MDIEAQKFQPHELHELELVDDLEDHAHLLGMGMVFAGDEALYHPDHWEAWVDSLDPESGRQDFEYRVDSWRFKSRTTVARKWLYMED